jgi:hypothetical protein
MLLLVLHCDVVTTTTDYRNSIKDLKLKPATPAKQTVPPVKGLLKVCIYIYAHTLYSTVLVLYAGAVRMRIPYRDTRVHFNIYMYLSIVGFSVVRCLAHGSILCNRSHCTR